MQVNATQPVVSMRYLGNLRGVLHHAIKTLNCFVNGLNPGRRALPGDPATGTATAFPAAALLALARLLARFTVLVELPADASVHVSRFRRDFLLSKIVA